MGSEDLQRQPDANSKGQDVAAELASLSARVDALERQLADLRGAAREVGTAESVAAVASVPVAKANEAVVAPPPPPPPAPLSSTAAKAPSASLENRLGAQVFNRVGILALLIGAAWFLQLAFSNHWIGPVGRILCGLVAGAGVVVWSERFRRKGFPAFSYSLKAIGSGVLYLSLWAAFQLYHLLPASAALVGMILVTAWNAYMAWAQDAELLAAYAVAGGFATPLLLSTGGNHESFLFTYLLAIDVATVLLVRSKPWQRLLLGAFPATVIYFAGWYMKFYAEPAFAVTVVFVALFFLVFASVPIGLREVAGVRRIFGRYISLIYLPLLNAAFVSLALYSVMQDSDRHWFLPWLMVILAAAYLLLMRLPQSEIAAAMHLSIAVVFLTIAIPLKASGHWITVAWLVEGLALAWVSGRLAGGSKEAALGGPSPSRVLRWLSAGAFVLGLCGLIAVSFWFEGGDSRPFFNSDLSAALIGVAALADAGWIALRAREKDSADRGSWTRFVIASLMAIDLIGVLLCFREAVTFRPWIARTAFFNTDFATVLVGLAVLGGVVWMSLRLSRGDGAFGFLRLLAGASVIAINLLAVLSGVREIEALWPASAATPEAVLQQALAVSGFLMVYGAVLLAIGFWKRTAFIRWQALVLIVFTILKTFLYDMRNLSQGYRVVSFLGLGVLLMAISFAYQKDWLALRDPAPPNPNHETGPNP